MEMRMNIENKSGQGNDTFTVTVRTLTGLMTYPALGTDSGAVHLAALDQFGVCGVTVKPA
jgi:hypothetical protein